jgi:hypothetical protein
MISNGQNHVIGGSRARNRVGDNGRPRRHRLVLAAAALSLVVAACDGDDDDVDEIEEEIQDELDEIEGELDEIGGEVADAIAEFGEDSVEVAARNLASRQGAEEFADSGHAIDGDLECTADATADLTAVEISCEGATEDGAIASLTGSTTELPGASLTELEGEFVGLVDDEEVFDTDALG